MIPTTHTNGFAQSLTGNMGLFPPTKSFQLAAKSFTIASLSSKFAITNTQLIVCEPASGTTVADVTQILH
jgi:hypothetical protein